jgi:hypothetical protein
MDAEAEEQNLQRRNRRRSISIEIRNIVAANSQLENELRIIGSNFARLKRMNQSLPAPTQFQPPPSQKKKRRPKEK